MTQKYLYHTNAWEYDRDVRKSSHSILAQCTMNNGLFSMLQRVLTSLAILMMLLMLSIAVACLFVGFTFYVYRLEAF